MKMKTLADHHLLTFSVTTSQVLFKVFTHFSPRHLLLAVGLVCARVVIVLKYLPLLC